MHEVFDPGKIWRLDGIGNIRLVFDLCTDKKDVLGAASSPLTPLPPTATEKTAGVGREDSPCNMTEEEKGKTNRATSLAAVEERAGRASAQESPSSS